MTSLRILKQEAIRRQVVLTATIVLVPLIGASVWSANLTRLEREAGIIYSCSGSIGYLQGVWGGATFYCELPVLAP